MSVLASTTALYRQVAFTHPVRATNGETARGFYNAPGEQPTVIESLAAAHEAPTLQLLTDDVTRLGLTLDVELEIGALGGTSASGWRRFAVRRATPLTDGAESLVILIPLE